MYKTIIISIAIILGSMGVLHAQHSERETRVMQLSFGFPVGSNGLNSPNVMNNISYNILWGVNGGVMGVEVGGLLNYNTDDVFGAQLAGISNITHGNSSGIVTSGITNFATKDMLGLHMAGIANTTLGNAKGIQVAGIANTSLGNGLGLQVAGISNTVLDTTTGVFVSGISNYSGGPTMGTHLSTINITTNEFEGAQIGTVNMTTGTVTGGQVGVVNYADTLKGIQLGVVNVSRSVSKGLPIGVLSIVKDGYFAFELSASETHLGMLSYKMGVERFYNIFSVAYQNNEGDNSLAYAYGIGTLLPITEHSKINIEASASHSFYHDDMIGINQLNTLKARYTYTYNELLSVHAGPTYNVYVRNLDLEPNQELIRHPKALFSYTGDYVKVTQWVGLSAGITISI